MDRAYRFYRVSDDMLRLTTNYEGNKFVMTVNGTALGGYDAIITKKEKNLGCIAEAEYARSDDSIGEAIDGIAAFVQDKYSGLHGLLNINAKWRERAAGEPCTDKQWHWIERRRLSELPRAQISKAEASELLSKAFNK